jgi:hypothetical protein
MEGDPATATPGEFIFPFFPSKNVIKGGSILSNRCRRPFSDRDRHPLTNFLGPQLTPTADLYSLPFFSVVLSVPTGEKQTIGLELTLSYFELL